MGFPWFAKERDSKDFISHLNSLKTGINIFFIRDVGMPLLVGLWDGDFLLLFLTKILLLLQNDKKSSLAQCTPKFRVVLQKLCAFALFPINNYF